MSCIRCGMVCLLLCVLTPLESQAQSLVVSKCIDRTRTGFGKRIHNTLLKQLQLQGNDLIGFRTYLAEAKKQGLVRKVNRSRSINSLAQALDLAGVVTCFVQQTKKRYRVVLRLYDSRGTVRLKKVYFNKHPRLASRVLSKLASNIATTLIKEIDKTKQTIAKADLKKEDSATTIELVPLVPNVGEQSSDSSDVRRDGLGGHASGAKTVAHASDWEDLFREDEQPKQAEKVSQSEKGASEDIPADVQSTAATTSDSVIMPEVAESEPIGVQHSRRTSSVANLLMVAGTSSHVRAGLGARNKTDIYAGMHLQGRFFLNTVTDMWILKDLGLSVLYEQSFGLKYVSETTGMQQNAHQQHLRLELLYRLNFDSPQAKPGLVFRFAYGDLKHSINTKMPEVKSARYTYLAGMLECNIWLARPWFGFQLGVGYLANVKPADELAGSGTGIIFNAGLSVELVDLIHIGLGYEQVQFILNERSLGATSDRYQTLFLCFGLSYR